MTELSSAEREQRRQAARTHGARSEALLAPQIVSMKRALLARMGLRQGELTWVARELLDAYCRSQAKVVAIDQWLQTAPLIREDGSTPGVMKLYLAAMNTSRRTLAELVVVLREQARSDQDIAGALAALESERGRQ